jgi:mono/diheme cytochrome c family protein
MLANILIILALAGLAAVFGWLVRRSLKIRNLGARLGFVVLSAIPALIFAAASVCIGLGYYTFYGPRTVSPLAIDTTPSVARVTRGAHLARTTCVACHATNNDLPLSGGIDLSSHSPMPIGTLVPPNLTPGGPLKDWSDAEIVQAIRNGLHKDGRALLMPTNVLRNLSDEDVASIVAFLRSQPAVEKETPPFTPSPLLAFFFGAGLAEFGSPPMTETIIAPLKEPTATYGEYVLSYQDCRACHGDQLHGSPAGLGPATPSVRAFVKAWSLEQFIQTMRTGVTPDGRHLDPIMPWQMVGQMDDVELAALYHHLRSMDS